MLRKTALLALGVSALVAQDGAAIYKSRCAQCHDAPAGRVPPFTALRDMSTTKVLKALESGVMKPQAEGLSSADRLALIIYINYAPPKASALPPAAFCGGNPAVRDFLKGPKWIRWGAGLENTRFQEAADAGIGAAEVPQLKLKWAFGLGQTSVARAQPSIAAGRVFVGSEEGAVYSLDAQSGCIYWSFQADGPVSAPITIGEHGRLFFGDQKANVYSLDAASGKSIWKVHVDDHFAARVTGGSLLHEGVLYVPVASFEEALAPAPSYECCTFRGSVVALDAATGKQVWKTYTVKDAPQPTKISKTKAQLRGPSGASIWSSPTYDAKLDLCRHRQQLFRSAHRNQRRRARSAPQDR